MTIRFSCPHCGKQLVAPEAMARQVRSCPNCGANVTIPAAEADTPPSAATITETAPPADHPLLLFPVRTDHGNLIDMTAMVDIVFFLLIFFLVTSMQALEAVINLPTPEASESASSNLQTMPDVTEDPSLVLVTIDGDDAVWVEDEEALSEQDLRAKLRLARQDGDRDGILVKGAGDATHGKFVMVLDAAADAGMKEIMFSVEDRGDGGENG